MSGLTMQHYPDSQKSICVFHIVFLFLSKTFQSSIPFPHHPSYIYRIVAANFPTALVGIVSELQRLSPNLRTMDQASSTQTSSAATSPAVITGGSEQVVTPWDVQGQVSEDGRQLAINYDKLIDQFGTRRIDAALLERFEKVTGHKPHPLLRRGTFFSHRCVAMLGLFMRFLSMSQ